MVEANYNLKIFQMKNNHTANAEQNSAAVTNTSLHPAYRSDIDGLRAIAVLAVVAFHASPLRMPGGFVGVDIFFVISGYLISSIIFKNLEAGSFSFSDFYARRIKRIIPALLLVFATTLVLGVLLMPPPNFALLGKHVLGSVSFVENFVLFNEAGYFDTSAEFKPLLHIWSLSIEEQFYIVWPLLMALIWRLKKLRLSIVSGLLILSLVLNIYAVFHDQTLAFYFPFTRAWELIFGAMLAYLTVVQKGENARWKFCTLLCEQRSFKNVLSIMGALLLLASFLLINSHSRFPGYWAILPSLGALFLISAGPGATFNRYVLSRRLFVSIGLISYPLYLWHWPLLAFLRYRGLGDSLLNRALVVCASFFLAWITYRFVEQPVRNLGKGGKRTVPILLLACTLFGALGAYVYVNGGYVKRYPEEVRSFLLYHYDYKSDFRNDKCLLNENQNVFSDECVEKKNVDAGLPLVFIWGDSHGAHLYRAIESLHANAKFSLAQFTSSSCPPVLNFEKRDRPNCAPNNRFIAAKIESLRPRTVILAHDWPQSLDENSLGKIPDTVRFLRSNGVENIILIGPVPHWKTSLAASMHGYIEQTGQTKIPERSTFGLDQSISDLDVRMKKIADDAGIVYISPYQTFCDRDGCLTTMSGNPAVPSTFDNAHLTTAASAWFVEKYKDVFLR